MNKLAPCAKCLESIVGQLESGGFKNPEDKSDCTGDDFLNVVARKRQLDLDPPGGKACRHSRIRCTQVFKSLHDLIETRLELIGRQVVHVELSFEIDLNGSYFLHLVPFQHDRPWSHFRRFFK